MKGSSRFTSNEASRIKALLAEKVRASRDDQKRLRGEIRAIGFYITDFTSSNDGFGPEDFEALVKSGRVTIADKR